VQRLIDADGFPAAYRLRTLSDRASFLNVNAPFTGGEPDIFLHLPSRIFDPTVFETTGVELLNQCKGKRLVLLDEIGGLELLVPLFRDALFRQLQEEIPCVGIIKERKKSREALVYNDLLRSVVSVIPITQATLSEIPYHLNKVHIPQLPFKP